MPHWPFPEFLENETTYAEAQHYWSDLWDRVLRTANPQQPWQHPWMTNPSRDGNPIFTALCKPLGKGVRIIQEEPGDPDDLDLDWWLDDFGEKTDPEAIRERVLACSPSRENAAQIEHLLQRWVRNGDDATPPSATDLTQGLPEPTPPGPSSGN